MRSLHIWIIAALVATVSLFYLSSGLYYTMLPVDGTLTNRIGGRVGTDFRVFYVAGLMVADGQHVALYSIESFEAFAAQAVGGEFAYTWNYPPFFLFVVALLATLPFIPAMILWGLAPVGATAWMFVRVFPHRLTPVLGVLSPPIIHNFLAGQNGALSAAILGWGLVLLPVRPVAAGLVLSLAAFKPHLALLIPVCLIAGRHFRTLFAMALGVLGLAMLGLAVFGLEAWMAFAMQIGGQMGHLKTANLPVERMPTIFATTLRVTESAAAAQGVQTVGSIAAIGCAALAWYKTRNPAARALTLVSATLLATPYAFDYDLAMLSVPFIWIIGRYAAHRSPAVDPIVLLAIWFAPILVFLADAGVGFAILLGLFAYGMWRASRTGARGPWSADPAPA